MVPSRTVTLLAADIPLRDRLRLDVELTEWQPSQSGPVGRAEFACGSNLVHQSVPLATLYAARFDGLRPIERPAENSRRRPFAVSLLPLGPVDKCDVLFLERKQRVRLRQIGKDNLRMHFGIGHDVCHSRLAPALVHRRVTGLTG
jgi:hypothetical protein